jgi:hypothetical protein
MSDGAELGLEANLAAAPLAGFARAPAGRVIFSTHPSDFAGETAPAWGVRWTIS